MEEIIWYREMVWHSNADSIGTVTYQRTDIDSMNCLSSVLAFGQWPRRSFRGNFLHWVYLMLFWTRVMGYQYVLSLLHALGFLLKDRKTRGMPRLGT